MKKNIRNIDDIVAAIKKNISGLSTQQRKVGIFICEHPEVLGLLPLQDLATRAGTSSASVTRFCRSLGYAGFLDFTRAMQKLREIEITHASLFQEAYNQNVAAGDHEKLARRLVETDQNNTLKLLRNYPAEKIATSVSYMLSCDTISVIGRMSAYPLAVYFEQLLSKITSKLICMSVPDVLQAATLSRINSSSLVFCIAFPRYPQATIDLTREARKRKAKIVCITNSEFSPLVPISDLFFPLDTDVVSYIDILGPAFALINILCMEFSMAQATETGRNLDEYDRMVKDAFFMQ